jgi:F-box/leucine-rich repeat protein 7
MRRVRPGAGGTLHANRANSTGSGSSIDPLSLIRSFDSESIPTLPVRPSPLSASTFQGLPLDLLDRLRSFPLFLSAPDSFLAAIGSHLRPQLHNPHDYVLNEGDDAKAMYWLVRGALVVTSRDGESTYAELKPGAFFGEIGILMDIPRTATVVAKLKSLVVRLNKEDLQKVLPSYPEVERAIRDEALERLAILERKKKELGGSGKPITGGALLTSGVTQLKLPTRVGGKRPRSMDGEVLMAEAGVLKHGEAVLVSSKKRKSPSPSLTESLASSALGSGSVNVRILLRELPLFTTLPADILHFIGLNAQPMSYPPFTEIIKQGATGRDIFFIVRGEVEVVSEKQKPVHGFNGAPTLMLPVANGAPTSVIARLRPGQYFGEVTSLSLAPRRTATVRSISSVEALMISGDVLDELWEKCSPDLRRQVERTARDRLKTAYKQDDDVEMMDTDNTPAIGQLELDDVRPLSPNAKGMFSLQEAMFRGDEPRNVESIDPDPYLNVDLENVRSRSRRGSLAPPSPSTTTPSETSSIHLHSGESSPIKPTAGGVSNGIASVLASGSNFISRFKFRIEPISPKKVLENKRARMKQKSLLSSAVPSYGVANSLPENVIALILRDCDIHELMKARVISTTWMKVASNDDTLLHTLDLTPFNRWVNDRILLDVIAPFAKSRPKMVDVSNCFHVTDEGFQALATACADNVKVWKMKSVWDVTGQAVLDMTNKAKSLEEIDLSNCRKVGDNLLARVVGWVVPEMAGGVPSSTAARRASQASNSTTTSSNGTTATVSTKNGVTQSNGNTSQTPAPGTVIGCPKLKRLTLSYCKHITDRSMAHIATHAAQRIEEMDLTRCTTITDAGFHSWSVWSFPRLTKLCLADCTYLTDNAVVWLTHAARGLKWLDLVCETPFELKNLLTLYLELLLCPFRYCHRGPRSWLSFSPTSQPCFLRLRSLRCESSRCSPPSLGSALLVSSRLCSCDRPRC